MSLRKGFTLIEILLVITLIGIFVGSITYFTRDSRIAMTNAERLANNIGDTIKNARNNMIIGRGIYSGSQLVSTEKRTISIKGGEISTIFAYNNGTNTGTETSLRYPFYENDGQYQITDVSVSSGVLVNNYAMSWDHTGVTTADITVLPNGDLTIAAVKGGVSIPTPINTIRITAGYQGFERSVVLDRVMGRMDVIKGKEGSDNPPLNPINGVCNNSTQFACTSGNAIAQVGGTCGGNSTWSCTGVGGGTSENCSMANPPCPINGVCNNTTQYACSAGISIANSPGSCGGFSTWSCQGQYGGTTDISCNRANVPCPVNGVCGATSNVCSAGTPNGYSAGSCGGSETWSCLGQFGGSTSNCSIPNIPCPVNGVCNNSTQFACTTGTSVSNNPGVCGGSSTWGCNGQFGGTSTTATACTIANPPCPVNGSCGGTNNTCSAGSPSGFSAGSCGGSSSWTCNGSGGGSNASCGIANAPCAVNCSYTTYQGGSCSATCGGGNFATYYTKTVVESGGGTCPISEGQFAGWSGSSCNTFACAVNGSCGGTNNTCSSGSPSGFSAGSCGGSSSWTCNGSGGGSNASCTLPNAPCVVNGSCGGSNNTCSSGSPSGFSAGSCGGSSSWSCLGSGGGTNASCGIPNAPCAVNGSCGGTNNTCSSGSPSGFSAGSCGGSSSWSCLGSGGGTNASCGIPNAPCAVNGSCGGSNNTCSSGSPSGFSAGSCGGSSSWTCNGSGGGSNASCGIANAPCAVNCSYTTYQGGSCSATCGGGNFATYYTKTVVESGGGTCPISEGQFAGWSGSSCNTFACAVNGSCGGTNNTCSSGSPSGFSAGSCGGSSSWTCNGSGGGSNASCTLPNAPCVVNGSCGGSNNTCSSGSPSGFSAGSCGGSSSWSCLGSGGGTNASCGIPNAPCAVNGSCGGTNNTCSSGSPSGFSAGSCGGSSSWTCNGSGGGSNASCGIANAPCAVNCVGSWSNNGTCSATCGGGVLQQTYTITTPASGGGTACSNNNGDTRWGSTSCNTAACPMASCTSVDGHIHSHDSQFLECGIVYSCQDGTNQALGCSCQTLMGPEHFWGFEDHCEPTHQNSKIFWCKMTDC